MKINKRGDVAAGITWVVALIIIVFILLFFLAITSIFTTKGKPVFEISYSKAVNNYHEQINMQGFLLAQYELYKILDNKVRMYEILEAVSVSALDEVINSA